MAKKKPIPAPQSATYADRVPLLVLTAGLLLSLFLFLQVPDEVFVNGDGGIKLLLARQFLAGQWGVDLRPPAEPFVEELWRQGYAPLDEPFVYVIRGRYVQCFPPFFSLITAPFYAGFGFRGLYVVPVISGWIVWLRFWWFGRKIGLGWQELAIGLATLIFASPLTVYCAMYWEHTLAVALAFCGIVELILAIDARPPRWRLAAAGVLLGLAGWFRPENICFAAAWLAASLVVLRQAGKLREWTIGLLGVGAALAVFFAINFALYKHPLGAHSFSVIRQDSFWEHLRGESLPLLLPLGWDLLTHMPPAVFAVVLAIWFWFRPSSRPLVLLNMLILTVLLYWLAVPFIVTHSGGVQWGPRYLLNAVPLLALAVAITWQRLVEQGRLRTAFGLLTPLLIWGSYVNCVDGTEYLRDRYHNQLLPALEFLRQRDEEFVVINHQYVAQELASAWDRKKFLRADGPEQFVAVATALRDHGINRFLLIVFAPVQPPALLIQQAGDFRIEARLLGKYGRFPIYEAQIAVQPAL